MPALSLPSLCPPAFTISFSILLSWASVNLQHSAARADISEVTHAFVLQAAMTVTDMYIMLSDSVRHASCLLLFIWKLFNVSGLNAGETYSGSFLYQDSHFAGVDTLLYMNIKHILLLNSRNLAEVLIQSDFQKVSSMGDCQCLNAPNFSLSWQQQGLILWHFGCWISQKTCISERLQKVYISVMEFQHSQEVWNHC